MEGSGREGDKMGAGMLRWFVAGELGPAQLVHLAKGAV